MEEKLVVEANLVHVGTSAPVEDGLGTIGMVIVTLEIECLPGNLISEIEVDVSRIKTPDDVVLVRDLEVPEGVEILADPDEVVARFDYIQLIEEEEEEEEESLLMADVAEEVEVIAKGKQADEEEFED
jgi:large subunit ribosomal protein L25